MSDTTLCRPTNEPTRSLLRKSPGGATRQHEGMGFAPGGPSSSVTTGRQNSQESECFSRGLKVIPAGAGYFCSLSTPGNIQQDFGLLKQKPCVW